MNPYIKRLDQLYHDGRSLPGLESITRLLHLLGDPQERIACIHVAGTNGKGSTCAYMESILREAGYHTGFFPSPHLHRYTEYMRIQGEEIGENQLAHYAKEVLAACEALVDQGFEHPTFFEAITACTYLCFADQQVDIAIIETAMGGRLDATNVITPVLSVITKIGMDHVAVLGPGIDDIAREKAGIIKEGIPVVMANQEYSLPQMVISSVCQDKGCQLWDVEDYKYQIIDRTLSGQRFSTTIHDISYTIDTPLLGDHQVDNAMTALVSMHVLNQRGYTVSHDAILKGIRNTVWSGRMQILKLGDKSILMDGAHNPQAANALATAMKHHLPKERVILLCGILTTKDVTGVTKAFSSFAHQVVCTKPRNLRAMEAQDLLFQFERCGVKGVAIENVEEAAQRALSMAEEENALWIVVAGSLYMLADIEKALEV